MDREFEEGFTKQEQNKRDQKAQISSSLDLTP